MNIIEQNIDVVNASKISQDSTEFEQHVDKCLSMIYHYPEVEQIGAIIKRIGAKRLAAKAGQYDRNEGDN